MAKVTIRSVKQNEVKTVHELETACFPPAEAASLEDVTERLKAFPENFFIAEMNGKPIGYINGNTTDKPELPDELYHDVKLHKPDGEYNTVFGIGVLPEYRRKRIGHALLNHFINFSKISGRKGVILVCKEKLIPFYEACGFKNQGKSLSTHGGAEWYDMLCTW